MSNRSFLFAVFMLLVAGLTAGPAFAQNNLCDQPGEFPDVIVGDLHQVQRYGTANGITAYSVGTVSCNIGTCWLNWISSTSEHPVIAQNMYRIKDGRMEQIGQSWLKHGFFALSEGLCSDGCLSTNGAHLGVNCSDPYSAGLNGSQSGLGPRSEVNASTGEFPYPFTTIDQTGNVLYKRLQVKNEDLDPALNPGAIYLVEGQYVSRDDAAAGKAFNNASWRQVLVSGSNGTFNLTLTGSTFREQPAVQGWSTFDVTVKSFITTVPDDGRFIMSAKVSSLGGNMWRYEYALQNLNSHRSAMSFSVPVPAGASVTNIDFHDVDYHSGEPYDGTDWDAQHDQQLNRVHWTTDSFDVNPDANALRWGTLYSFGFDSDAAPVFGVSLTIGLFLPGTPSEVQLIAQGPNPCNNDGTCDIGETCTNCANDCVNNGPPTGFCGDGVCEPALGENCVSCPSDCNGQQGGPQSGRFCCGDGGGQGAVGCTDSRCRTGGFTCGSTSMSFCCGDGVCEPGVEDSCICPADCGPPPSTELVCTDGIDNDCDGQIDCADRDCCTDATCADGLDGDGDGVAECDCDDGNALVWAAPSEAEDLTVFHDPLSGTTSLSWQPPIAPGAVSITYDVLRSDSGSRFAVEAVCMTLADPGAPNAVELDTPPVGGLFAYLVRAVNDCPDGLGSLGEGSGGDGRSVPSCP